MGDFEEGSPLDESGPNDDLSNEVLYRKLEILKSKLDIDFSIPKDDPVDFIFIVVHGIGTTDTMLESDYKSLKHSLEVVRKHWFYNQKLNIHLRFINWKKYIVDAQNILFDNVAIDTVKGMRRVFTLAVMDIVFYFNPKYSDYLLLNVSKDINGEIERLRNHPNGLFQDSKIVLIGYSMGSVIVDELIRVDTERISNVELNKRPRLEHKVDYFFAIGSPLSCSLIYHKAQLIKDGLKLPEDIEYYNIFHPYDPIAFRWEKIIYNNIQNIPKPVIIPYWYNNGLKNWYNIDQQFQYCKSLIVDNINDVANSISKSLFNWFNNPNTNDNISILNNNTTNNSSSDGSNGTNNSKNNNNISMLKKKVETIDKNSDIYQKEYQHQQVECENDKTNEDDEILSDIEIDNSSNSLEKLNLNSTLIKRYDYQVQEDATEHFLNPLAILQSHISYWGSRDVAFFMIKTVHNKKEKIPITTLLTHIESKAKSLSMSTKDEYLKKEFMKVVDKAKKILDEISKEDIKFKNESIIALKSTWNLMNKTKDDDVQAFDTLISDNIEQEEINPELL